jgi:CubicO group peptidase (beta-lactamase class C family)
MLAAASGAVCAELPIPMAKSPEQVGLSSSQLARIEAVTRANIAEGSPRGAVILVARRGKVAWFTALGERDAGDAMRTDALFRIYSMTKPVVSLAAMMLVEEGKLLVTDPVSRFIPEMAGMKVGVEKKDAAGNPFLELTTPQREMTVQDLLRHTSGLVYPGGADTSAVNRAFNAAGLFGKGMTTEEFVARVSKLPLRFSPGSRWEYGISTDVLGRVLEVIEKKKLSLILEERILAPLGMHETAFFVPAEKSGRIAQPLGRDGVSLLTFDATKQPTLESGGGGLVGTTQDYLRFALMLANGGTWNGRRYVSRKTLEYMTSNHVGDMMVDRPGFGFGLGFEVRTAIGEAATPGSVGEYGWSGAAGTTFWIDPKEGLVALYMTQVPPADRLRLRTQFRAMLEAAIVD